MVTWSEVPFGPLVSLMWDFSCYLEAAVRALKKVERVSEAANSDLSLSSSREGLGGSCEGLRGS